MNNQFRSNVLGRTLSPVWNDEEWIVRNVPMHAKLKVSLYDKDDNLLDDDFIGSFEISHLANYRGPAEGQPIIGPKNKKSGFFHLTIEAKQRSSGDELLPRYIFDGPCRYLRHDSSTFGLLTMVNTESGYSTWKIPLRRLSMFFHDDELQPWNRDYPIAQSIFGGTTRSVAKQNAIRLAHKILYGRTTATGESGRLCNAEDLWKKIFIDPETSEVRLRTYTYVIDHDSWRFSETGAKFFQDFASKHALHANCNQFVRFAGQFHPRPKHGWDQANGEWELVFDNWSGTYAPHPKLFTKLKAVLEFNFPGLNIATYDFQEVEVRESLEKIKSIEINKIFNPPSQTEPVAEQKFEQTENDKVCRF